MVDRIEFTFPSSDGLTEIRALKWVPDREIVLKGILQLVHGMQEFIDRYDDFARFMAEHGYVVYGHDLLGHGASIRGGDERRWGYFGTNLLPGEKSPDKGGKDSAPADKGEKEGGRILVRDIRRLQSIAQDEYPDLPIFLLGHSMGSFLARAFLCLYGSSLKAAVISGTAWHTALEANAGMMLAQTTALSHSWFYRSPFLNNLVLGSSNKQFTHARTPADWLTRDEKIVDRYLADKRTRFTFTCNGFYSLFHMLHYLTVRSNLERMPKDLPVLFIAGAQDPIGNNGDGPRKTAVQLTSLGLKKTECKIYPHCRHEVLNELNREEVYRDVLNFLDKA